MGEIAQYRIHLISRQYRHHLGQNGQDVSGQDRSLKVCHYSSGVIRSGRLSHMMEDSRPPTGRSPYANRVYRLSHTFL